MEKIDSIFFIPTLYTNNNLKNLTKTKAETNF